MKYSFITCTYNRDKYIGRTLNSIGKQEFSPDCFEAVIVDNNSTDNTEIVCQDVINEFSTISFQYVKEKQQGLSFALNRGIKEAKGEYLIFIDDDETISQDYLQTLDNYLQAYPNAQLCGTKVVPVYESEQPNWLSHYTLRLITGYYDKGKNVKLLSPKDFPGTGHTIAKKELFEKYGYYNTELGRKGKGLIGAEDKDMFYRLHKNNVPCYYFPELAIYHHIPEEKLTEEFFQKISYSVGKSERIRTYTSSKEYINRLILEGVKWMASVVLCIGYTFALQPKKGIKLLQFRKNVTKGLLGK